MKVERLAQLVVQWYEEPEISLEEYGCIPG